jgi:hypothetical protein
MTGLEFSSRGQSYTLLGLMGTLKLAGLVIPTLFVSMVLAIGATEESENV